MDLNITLPEDWKPFIDAEVAAGGYDSPADYIHVLLMQAKLRKARAQIERLLDEAVQGGEPREWTDLTLEEIRRRVHQQPAKQPENIP